MPTHPQAGLPSPFYRVALRALIRDSQGRLLVVENGDHEYELPGGGWEHDETPVQCMGREIEEELGVQASHIGDVLFFYRGWSSKYRFWMLRLCMPVTLDTHNFTPGDGMQSARFVGQEDFASLKWCEEDAPITAHAGQIWPAVEKNA